MVIYAILRGIKHYVIFIYQEGLDLNKRIIAAAISTFLAANLISINPVNVEADKKINPSIKIEYHNIGLTTKSAAQAVPKNELSLLTGQDIERQGVQSFCVDGDYSYFLDNLKGSVIIYKNNKYVRSISLNMDNPLDLITSKNILYVHNGTSILEYNLSTNKSTTMNISSGGNIRSIFVKNRLGEVFLDGQKISATNSNKKTFLFNLMPSSKDTSKFVNAVSGKIVTEISFSHENGGAQIIGEDKYGNTYINVKDIQIGKAIDFYQNIIYKIDPDGGITDKIIIPDDYSYTVPYKYVFADEDGKIYYLYSDIDGAKLYPLNEEHTSLLDSLLPKSKVSAITRKEAQERAINIAEVNWHYIKSKNGNYYGGDTHMPPQLKDKTDSWETGIPYCWGGNDSLDGHSGGASWTNYLDAINNYNASAGYVNSNLSGYKGGTAGLDCSGYIQSVFKMTGKRYTTYSIPQICSYIGYDELKDMDILDQTSEHVVIFQSWYYDVYGGRLGANTLEETGGNGDGTGKKAKKYYRTIDELRNGYSAEEGGYTALRYNQAGSDYIENNTSEPGILSPLYYQEFSKEKDTTVNFSWQFRAPYSGGQQTAYDLRIYSGVPTSENSGSGIFILEKEALTADNSINIDITNFAEGDYYFTLELKNDRGYWSQPIVSPFMVWDKTSSIQPNGVIQSTTRLAGNTRYDTSAEIAKDFSSGTINSVIIASGNNYPDALSSAILSKKYNAPILIVDTNVDPDSPTIQYIESHLIKAGNIYIIGGAGVVSSNYEKYFGSMGFKTIRLGGATRYETCAKVADQAGIATGTPVVIANSYSYPDALSIANIAAQNGWPILLNAASGLDATTKNYLTKIRPRTIYIAGGTGVITDSLKSSMESLLSLNDSNVVRLGGVDRYDTSKIIATYFYGDSAPLGYASNAYIASGTNFPDALCINSLAIDNGPVLLASGDDYMSAYIAINAISQSKINIHIAGGTGILPDYLISKIQYLSKLNR